MKIRWVKVPCRDCKERHVGCHSSCEQYKEYQTKYKEECEKMAQEKMINGIINDLNYLSSVKDRSRQPEPLKHGRLKKKKWD